MPTDRDDAVLILDGQADRADGLPPGTRGVVLVEGVSDQLAVEVLAARLGRDLGAAGVVVLPMGGATNIGKYLDRFGRAGSGLRLAGLCDENEVPFFQRHLARVGYGQWSRDELAANGFGICSADLEDELIRSLGNAAVERILEENGDLAGFRTFQQQPAQRSRPRHAQLHRFMGTRGGRKIDYAPKLVGALDLDRVPQPLLDVLRWPLG